MSRAGRHPGLGWVAALGMLGGVCECASAQDYGHAILIAQGFDQPVCVGFVPGDTTRLFLLQISGKILIVSTRTGSVLPTPFINLLPLVCCDPSANMDGLTFDLDYTTNGYFYVHYQGVASYSATDRYTGTGTQDAGVGIEDLLYYLQRYNAGC